MHRKKVFSLWNIFTVDVAQLVRASDCGSGGRGFKSRLPPHLKSPLKRGLFLFSSGARSRFLSRALALFADNPKEIIAHCHLYLRH